MIDDKVIDGILHWKGATGYNPYSPVALTSRILRLEAELFELDCKLQALEHALKELE